MKQHDSTRSLLRRIVPSRWVPFACPLCARPVEVPRRDLGADLHCPHCTAWIAAPDPRKQQPAAVRDPRILEAIAFQRTHGQSLAPLRRRDRSPRAPAPAPAPKTDSTPCTAAGPAPQPAAHRPSATPVPDTRLRPSSPAVFRPAEVVTQDSFGPDATPEWDLDLGTSHRVPVPGFYLPRATRAAWAVTSILVLIAIGMFIFRDLESRTEQSREERLLMDRLAATERAREAARIAEKRRTAIPVEVARRALGASGWREALPFVRHATRVSPLMKDFYEERPWKPLALSENGDGRFTTLENHQFYVFDATDASGTRHALGLEKTPGGWKLDWEVFADLASHEWTRFIQSRPAAPSPLRVGVIKRTPTPAMLEAAGVPEDRAFGVMLYGPDISQGVVYAVLEKESPLAAALGERVTVESGQRFILEISFLQLAEALPSNLVAIHRIVERGWTYMENTPPSALTLQTATN